MRKIKGVRIEGKFEKKLNFIQIYFRRKYIARRTEELKEEIANRGKDDSSTIPLSMDLGRLGQLQKWFDKHRRK